jgi:hypothetical protein
MIGAMGLTPLYVLAEKPRGETDPRLIVCKFPRPRVDIEVLGNERLSDLPE